MRYSFYILTIIMPGIFTLPLYNHMLILLVLNPLYKNKYLHMIQYEICSECTYMKMCLTLV